MNNHKSILVHQDGSPRDLQRIALARRLAPRSYASLHAVYAVHSSFLALPFALAEASDIGVAAIKLDEDNRERARAQFRDVMTAPGAEVSWEELQGDPVIWHFVQRALYADLVVMGQRERDPAYARALPADFLESVLMGSGKPVLIQPFASACESEAQRVLVAWNATRESARALFAAMPLLQQAGHVDIAAWQDDTASGAPAERELLARCLDHHGVTANLRWYGPASADTGNTLLSLAAELGSDLLVAGCYGHSRARELVLGGTTRTLLNSMTVPVLMVH